MLNVLIVGSGGREDAICHRISLSNNLNKLFAIPGNPGMERYAKCVNIDPNNFVLLKNFCKEQKIDLVVIGAENFLANGLADYLRASGINVFGPSSSAARIESSKAFAKDLMKKYNVPTANYNVFDFGDFDKLIDHLKKSQYPLVIKADGLAAGKGVIIADNFSVAFNTVEQMMKYDKFGTSGKKIVIEEFLYGEEVSLFVLTDGINFVLLNPAQDYKKIYDEDKGPNTGGMGSYCFKEILNDEETDQIEKQIIEPVLKGLKELGCPFNGCLYCGLIKTDNGIKVIEFNCRFGDPETQAVLQTLDDDLLEILFQISTGLLKLKKINSSGYSVCLVLASKGYPEAFQKGFEISGLDLKIPQNILIFHAGTQNIDGKIFTSGGRVINIVASGKQVKFNELIKNVYSVAENIYFENKYFRTDIGLKALSKIND